MRIDCCVGEAVCLHELVQDGEDPDGIGDEGSQVRYVAICFTQPNTALPYVAEMTLAKPDAKAWTLFVNDSHLVKNTYIT